ncbi:hypothetical protein A2716_03265 [candidate division WWE3 bacterium RIFCSPHIGHO2_01_FULL_40_23]|uniref:O-antigen ligase-related domain-containing protein n=1 Tax=candidate division WWE3 bacterium RIFCSPLOWO2_01_FULL_41_18 TaxID=1802625 RepID=A0A1F4VD54_UNCKA|nr:MAG: hypothetical protein A2716_03265 [candidate division WWE3 bacterium RIFCSPHIGHO2_01_FULL_40_23]OGC54900.1 MAG: hypothetical protein A3A78_02875 [candidate division WWE3 bacterium RIFCSPLOWO2_01_FULL_41_18]
MKMYLLFLLLFVFLTASLGQFSVIASGENLKIYLFEILAFAFSVVGGFYLLNLKRKIIIPAFILFALLFTCYSLITLFISIGEVTIPKAVFSGFYIARFLIYVMVSLIIYNLVHKDKKLQNKTSKILIVSSLLVSVFGFIQLAIFPDLSKLSLELGWDPHINRLTSSFFDPNFAGAYIVLGFILLLSRFNELFSYRKTLGILVLIIHVLAIFLTFSRSTWLMLGVFVLITGLLRSKKVNILIFMVLFFSVYFFVPRVQTRLSGVTDPSDSARYRLISWQNALSIAKTNLWFGIGFNNYRYYQDAYGFFDFRDSTGGHSGSGSDSSLLLVLATTGIFGLISYLLIYASFLIKTGKGIFLTRRLSYPFVSFSSILSLFVHSQFVNSLFYPQILLWMWTLFAISYDET